MTAKSWTQADVIRESGWVGPGKSGDLSNFLSKGAKGVTETRREEFIRVITKFAEDNGGETDNCNDDSGGAGSSPMHGGGHSATSVSGMPVPVDTIDKLWAQMDENLGKSKSTTEEPEGTSCSGDSMQAAATALPSVDLVAPGGFRTALAQHILPRLRKFEPELILISAGFDGMASDPLGGQLGLVAEDYAWATRQIVHAAAEISSCQGRVVSVLEGGYDLQRETNGLAQAVQAHVRELMRVHR